MSRSEETPAVTRSEFLRLAALGAGGLGLTALAGCNTTKTIVEGSRPGAVVVITNGEKDSSRAILGLICATKLPKGDNHVWFVLDGVPLLKKGEAEKVTSPIFAKLGSAAKLLDEIKAQGAALHACPVCAEFFGVKGEARIDGVDEKGGDWLMEKATSHNMAWF